MIVLLFFSFVTIVCRKEDVEFVTCTVKGQSFMLHQIRKMIGN